MDLEPVPFRSSLAAYERQAQSLIAAHGAADPAAIDLFHRKHPRFLDETFKWRPKFIDDSEIRDADLSIDTRASRSPATTISWTGPRSQPTSRRSHGTGRRSRSNPPSRR